MSLEYDPARSPIENQARATWAMARALNRIAERLDPASDGSFADTVTRWLGAIDAKLEGKPK